MNQIEHNHQVALFQWASISEGRYPELTMLYAIPNGGHRDIRVAAKMKKEGVKRGVLDINLDVARFGFHGLRIELKAPYEKGQPRTKPTKEQSKWIEKYAENGYLSVVCWGWESARDQIEAYLK